MTSEEARKRLDTEPDFIYAPRFGHSLKQLMRRHAETEVPTRIIAQALLMTEGDVQELYETIVRKLRGAMKVSDESI